MSLLPPEPFRQAPYRKRTDPRVLRTGKAAAAASGGYVRVLADDSLTDVTVPIVRGLTVAAGDPVLMVADRAQLVVIARLGTSAAAAPEAPPPNEGEVTDPRPKPPATTITTLSLRPIATGTVRGGSVRPDTTDLYQGDWTGRGVNTGLAVYGLRTLPGTVTRAILTVKRLSGGAFSGQAPTFRLMAQGALTGAPALSGTHLGPALTVGQEASVALPVSWAQQLITSVAGGLAIQVPGSSPYVHLAGRAAWGPAFTLTLTVVR